MTIMSYFFNTLQRPFLVRFYVQAVQEVYTENSVSSGSYVELL